MIEDIDKVDSTPCENSSLAIVNCSGSRGTADGYILNERESRVWGHEPLSWLGSGNLKIQCRVV
jgi:hypothetical protein